MSSQTTPSPQGIAYTLKLTQHRLRLKMDEALRVLELTTPQYAVLSQLQACPGISNAALARAAFVTAQTMHGIIQNLEKRGLVARKPALDHGRVLSALLTSSGTKIIKDAHKHVKKVEKAMLESLALNEREELMRLLTMCSEHLANLN